MTTQMMTTLLAATLALSMAGAADGSEPRKTTGGKKMTKATMKAGYAQSNGAKVYYEVHGDREGTPLVLLHGSFMGIETTWAPILPSLTASRKVIAIEFRGHGHSTDTSDPFSFPAMAADVAAVLRHLEVKQADVLGYSMGGTVAAGVALRHPELVRKLIVVSAAFETGGFDPAAFEQFKALPADFAPKHPANSAGSGSSLQPDTTATASPAQSAVTTSTKP